MEKINVEGHPNLVRDSSSKAVINTNVDEYSGYKESYKMRQIEKNKISNIESNLDILKNEMNEIKALLGKLISQ